MVYSSPTWDDCGDELPYNYIAWAVMNLELDPMIILTLCTFTKVIVVILYSQ